KMPQLVSCLQQFFCKRHDGSNAVKKIINYHNSLHIKTNKLEDIKHCINICPIITQYVCPTNKSEIQKSDKFLSIIESYEKNKIKKEMVYNAIKNLSYCKSMSLLNQMSYCEHIYPLKNYFIEYMNYTFNNQYIIKKDDYNEIKALYSTQRMKFELIECIFIYNEILLPICTLESRKCIYNKYM